MSIKTTSTNLVEAVISTSLAHVDEGAEDGIVVDRTFEKVKARAES